MHIREPQTWNLQACDRTRGLTWELMTELWTMQTLTGKNLAKETEAGEGSETWRTRVSQERECAAFGRVNAQHAGSPGCNPQAPHKGA
jgi:hypothetical protein